MTTLKGDAIERFIKKPDKPIILLFGADHGRVTESAKAIRASIGASNDAFNEVTLDAATLIADPARLKDEAQTLSIFGDKRLIRIKADNVNISPALTLLLEITTLEAVVIIEAGDIKTTSPLVSLLDKSSQAAVLRLFSENIGDLSRRLDQNLKVQNQSISREARDWLLASLGADMALSNQELEKLFLYCHNQPTISLEDVKNCLSDASSMAIDDILDPTFYGDAPNALKALQKALLSDESPIMIMIMLTRHLQLLLQLRIKIEKGIATQSVIEGHRPPIFFTRKGTIERQLTKTTAKKLMNECEKIQSLSAHLRLSPNLAPILLERQILRLAMMSK